MGADRESLEHKRKLKNRADKKKKPQYKIIYIFTEGERTEPNYFKSFIDDLMFDDKKYRIEVFGCGYNTLSLVKQAAKKLTNDLANYAWCVFDKDDFPNSNVVEAYNFVNKQSKMQIAFSNECFELWYLLHFCYWNTGNPRSDYYPKLSEFLGEEYKKNSDTMYQKLKDNQHFAIQFAKKLRTSYSSSPDQNNPYTDVDLLIDWFKDEKTYGNKC